jgi:transformation/transcription domain-associated protein
MAHCRPLAYTALFDLVHHARSSLTLEQLSKVVFLYTRNIHDDTLPLAIQAMSAKLLWYLVECIVKNEGEKDTKPTRRPRLPCIPSSVSHVWLVDLHQGARC